MRVGRDRRGAAARAFGDGRACARRAIDGAALGTESRQREVARMGPRWAVAYPDARGYSGHRDPVARQQRSRSAGAARLPEFRGAPQACAAHCIIGGQMQVSGVAQPPSTRGCQCASRRRALLLDWGDSRTASHVASATGRPPAELLVGSRGLSGRGVAAFFQRERKGAHERRRD